MSTTSIPILPYVARQIIIYSGLPVFIAGIIGNILNIFVFLTLRTFRQSSCGFYLIIMSIITFLPLFLGLLNNIITAIHGIDGTESSAFYCKCRPYLFHVTTISSMSLFCLTTIDQYWATCAYPRLQQWCDLKHARYIVVVVLFFCVLHGVPYWFLFYLYQNPLTNTTVCVTTDPFYVQYRLYVNIFTLSGFLPISIVTVFGSMAFYNLGQIAHRTVPLVRRELEQQLTRMVLVQVIISIFLVLPYLIVNIFVINPRITIDLSTKYRIQIAYAVSLILNYSYFATPFYIYVCVSKRFRRQCIYVICRTQRTQTGPQI